ncbi:helix-turn-helix transcriptional regulator [Heyndrickxia ginsengihumi]|uniref:helix-turn-helix transcriptional regulator n=1 Tax=Heyndrickxia ginsengihumi TaxID=363870 RepID=UPI000471D477|nr:helix-turn-helix domain-containing protein [Heyndrickxia ginsengihumi]
MEYKCRLGVIFAERNIVQKEFADKIGVSSSTLTLIKKGRQYPSFPVTYRISEELDMDVREIWIKE